MPISTIGSNSLNQTSDLTINGQTVGKGGGNVATNTAHGVSALQANTSGANNVSIGYQASYSNTTASEVVAIGKGALYTNSTGDTNTAVGFNALTLATGAENTAFGNRAMQAHTTGVNNVAVGRLALQANTTASNNTAVGYQAGYTTTTGSGSTYIGRQAGTLSTGIGNTFVGAGGFYTNGAGAAMTTGSKNTILGGYDGNQASLDIRTLSNYIVLSDGEGNPRMVYEGDNNVWSAPQIYNSTTGSGANVHVGTTGRLYRSTSSLKYKTNVQAATFGLADVLKLRAVTYQGNGLDDGSKTYAGLIAEEVHDAGLTEFVQYAEDGTPDALAYGNMVSLLVKAIQELKTIVDAQAAEIAELKAKVAA
jgi:hypothetical protein